MSDWIQSLAEELYSTALTWYSPNLSKSTEYVREKIRQAYAAHCQAHPPLAELAERIGILAIEFSGRCEDTVEYEAECNKLADDIAAHIAPLYAENERLRMDVARKNALLFEVQQQVGNQCEDVKRHALTPGLRDRINAEIGATP